MAQHPGVPWDQRPDYVALTQRVDPAGIVTAYNPPRPGLSATDVTSFVYGQANITIDSWPEVMYYLRPTPEWIAFRGTAQPPQKLDANGQGMVERFPQAGQPPRPLLDFTILPDTICSQEELWWIELWRRMDPRIHWQDIIMRIELPNRTIDSDRRLQNATNNLINRSEHRLYYMLAWHSTGVNGMRHNEVRTWVLDRVAAAHPPLPPNSTRGLTPGLINPLLGDVPGNAIDHPIRRYSQGKLRRPPATQTTAAAANQGQGNQVNANRRYSHPVARKRDRTSPEPKGRRPKRQAQYFSDDPADGDMDTGSDRAKSSEEEPSTVAKARQKRTSTGPTSVVGKDKNTAVKKKPTSQKSATAKKTKRSSTYQQLKEAQRGWQDSTTENDPQDNEEDNDGADPQDNEEGSEGADPPANHFFFEGDAGYEEAFQAARRRHVSRAPPRRPFTTTPLTNRPVHDDSDFETPADADIDGSTQVAEAPPSETTIAPQEPASPAHPSDQSTPAPRRQIINPLTRQSRRGRHVRPGALSGYETRPVGDRGSPERSSRAAPSDIGVIEDDDGHASPTRLSYAASLGLPVASGNRPPRNFYCPFPEGSRSHYTDDSDTPTHVTHPTPSGGSRVSFTANQREAAQAAQANTSQPARAGQDAQPTTQNPTDAPSGQRNLTANSQISRLTEETARHSNAIAQEIHRRQQRASNELSRHAHAIRNIMREDSDNTYAAGFLAREMERERRERQPSSDDE